MEMKKREEGWKGKKRKKKMKRISRSSSDEHAKLLLDSYYSYYDQ